MSASNPKPVSPAGTGTSAEGHGAASDALSPTSDPFPSMRLIPAGTLGWPNSVVAIRYLDGSELPWRCSNGARLADAEVAGAQHLVPVRPLLELLARLAQSAASAAEHAEGVKPLGLEGWAGLAEGRLDATRALRDLLVAHSPESPAKED